MSNTKVTVRYDTSLGIYGPTGVRTVRIPKYVQRGYITVWDYIYRWLKVNVSDMAKPLEWWKE